MKRKKEQVYKTFQDEMFSSGAKNNLITATIILVYVLFFSGASFKEMGFMILFATISVLIFQFFVAPFTNASYTRNISNLLISWKEGSLDAKNTTILLIEVLRCPRIIMYFIFVLFGLASLLFLVLTYFFLNISLPTIIFLFIITAFASYVSGIVALYDSETVCNKYAISLFKSDLDYEVLKTKKYYGVSLKVQFVLFIIIPVFFISLLTLVYFFTQESCLLKQDVFQIGKTLVFFGINSLILIGLFIVFRNNSILEIGNVQHILEWLSVTDFKFEREVPFTLSNELSYISFLIKNTIKRFPRIIDFHNVISTEILERAFQLNTYKSEQEMIVNTSNRVITDLDSEIKNLERTAQSFFYEMDSYSDMYSRISKTLEEVKTLFSQSKENTNDCIFENTQATRGIKSLQNQLKGISEVTDLLNDIADQIKIIAFNAELEANKAGELGSNFLIIASEIRRLADYTMDSIIETRGQISLVQDTTENLVETIYKGIDLTKKTKKNMEKKEMLVDSIKTQIETEVIDIADLENNKNKQKQLYSKSQSLIQQINHLFEKYLLHLYDLANTINDLERIADTVAKGEI